MRNKKIFSFGLFVVMMFMFVACGAKKDVAKNYDGLMEGYSVVEETDSDTFRLSLSVEDFEKDKMIELAKKIVEVRDSNEKDIEILFFKGEEKGFNDFYKDNLLGKATYSKETLKFHEFLTMPNIEKNNNVVKNSINVVEANGDLTTIKMTMEDTNLKGVVAQLKASIENFKSLNSDKQIKKVFAIVNEDKDLSYEYNENFPTIISKITVEK